MNTKDEGTKVKYSEEVQALINKHGKDKLRQLEIPKDESHSKFLDVVAIIPSRTVIGQYMKWSDANPKKASEILIRGCIMTNRAVIEDDDFMFNTTVALVAELIPIGEGRIKKFS